MRKPGHDLVIDSQNGPLLVKSPLTTTRWPIEGALSLRLGNGLGRRALGHAKENIFHDVAIKNSSTPEG